MRRQEKKKVTDPKNVTDAVEVAEDAGLRYVSNDQLGYTRKAKGDDFEYFDTEGIAHCARSGQPRVIQRERSIDSGRRGDLTPIETSMSLRPRTPFPAGTLHFPAVADPA
jgi:hypothetical protein